MNAGAAICISYPLRRGQTAKRHRHRKRTVSAGSGVASARHIFGFVASGGGFANRRNTAPLKKQLAESSGWLKRNEIQLWLACVGRQSNVGGGGGVTLIRRRRENMTANIGVWRERQPEIAWRHIIIGNEIAAKRRIASGENGARSGGAVARRNRLSAASKRRS